MSCQARWTHGFPIKDDSAVVWRTLALFPARAVRRKTQISSGDRCQLSTSSHRTHSSAMPLLFHAREKNRERFILVFHVFTLLASEETSRRCMSDTENETEKKKYLICPEKSKFSPLFAASSQKVFLSFCCGITSSGFL